MPALTVVTAAKDAAAFLPAAIESIQRQTVTDWDYVIIDDGSSDDTAAVVERYAARDPRIRLVRLKDSVGPYAAANMAMLEATTPYLARIDADDVALPDRFRIQLDALHNTPSARGCTGSWQGIDEEGHVRGDLMIARTHRNAVLKWTFCLRSAFVHSTLMVDTAWFKARGGYGPERVAEDSRIWAALAREGKLAVLDAPLAQYRVHDSQITAAPGMRDDPARLRVRLDHLQQCSDADWTLDDARDLRYVGRPAPFPVARGLALLAKWETAWRGDGGLDRADRRELSAFTGRAYLGHIRQARVARSNEARAALLGNHSGAARALAQIALSPKTRWR